MNINMNVMNHEIAARLADARIDETIREARNPGVVTNHYGKALSARRSPRQPRLVAFVLALFA